MDEDARLMSERGGDNEPIAMKRAYHDGHRSVRVELGKRHVGLMTATYSYKLTHDERVEVARRAAALWNLAAALNLSTDEIEAKVQALQGRSSNQ